MEAGGFRRYSTGRIFYHTKRGSLLTTLHTLASGSSGNSLLISCGQTHLLVDAGISCRRISASLQTLGLSLLDLTAVLITHTHSDHISGLQTMLKKLSAPLLGTTRTCDDLLCRLPCSAHAQSLTPCQRTQISEITVTAIPTSHDTPGACGFRFDTEDGSIGVLTDTGFITEEAEKLLPGVDLAILESNYDPEALDCGPYPYYLKQRIAGQYGHLSNSDAARFAVKLARSGTSQIVLAHLSHENNSPAMAHYVTQTALSAAGLTTELSVAPRDRISEAYFLSGRTPCRK